MMPVLPGAEVIVERRALNPDRRGVAVRAMPGAPAGLTGEEGRLTFLRKPMTAPEVFATIRPGQTPTMRK